MQKLYQDNELDPIFGNTPLHSSTPAGWTSPAQTRGLTQNTTKRDAVAAVIAEMNELGSLSTK